MPIFIANLATNDPTNEDRQSMLDTFAVYPESGAIWETAHDWVRAEGDNAQRNGVASDIPAEELISMAERVRATDAADRYALMTEPASNGEIWFDVLKGFSDDSVRGVLTGVVADWTTSLGGPYYRALDLGTGVGKSLAVLDHNAETVIGLDRDRALLAIARQRAASNTTLIQAEVTALPFDNDRFDLISNIGIEGALDKRAQIKFYSEVGRVMMPGAVYVSAFYNYPDMPSEYMEQITETSKAMLADMISDTVSGGAGITERLDADETEGLLARLGLQKEYYLAPKSDEKNQIVIQAITKAH